ncbi:MAG: hypothetical protein AB4426_15355 [Xenococcaceae cyanobacterium]
MNDSDTIISDFYICEAFKQILTASSAELEQKLDSQARQKIATYLVQLPSEDKLNPGTMANHITAFCQQPGNKNLYEWLGDIYDRLDKDSIDKILKKTGDPGEEADEQTETPRMLIQRGRDICQDLQRLATEVQNQSNQGTQNASNPN